MLAPDLPMPAICPLLEILLIWLTFSLPSLPKTLGPYLLYSKGRAKNKLLKNKESLIM
jgi:hypothetical protein